MWPLERMIWVDYAVLFVVALSALISVFRGFIREAVSLVGWVLAFWVALNFSGDVAEALEGQIAVPSVRQAVAFFALFMAILLLTALVNWAAGLLIDKTGLSGTDRMLGIIFGVARGVVIVALLVLMAGLTPLPQDPWWRESTFIPHFESLAREVRAFLPPEIAERLQYQP